VCFCDDEMSVEESQNNEREREKNLSKKREKKEEETLGARQPQEESTDN